MSGRASAAATARTIGRALLVLAMLPASGCQPTTAADPTDDRATASARLANETATVDALTTRAAVAQLGREVGDLHNEVDAMKASRDRLRDEVVEARLLALEAKVQPPTVPIAVPLPAPVATRRAPAPRPTATPRNDPSATVAVPTRRATTDPGGEIAK